MTVQLFLEGASDLVVRMALLLYLSDLEKLKKKSEETYGLATDEIEESIDLTKDLLQQLGWKPKEKGTAEVVRADPAQLSLEPPAPPVAAADSPAPRSLRSDLIAVHCDVCMADFSAARTTGVKECPGCDGRYSVKLDDEGEIVRIVRIFKLPESGG